MRAELHSSLFNKKHPNHQIITVFRHSARGEIRDAILKVIRPFPDQRKRGFRPTPREAEARTIIKLSCDPTVSPEALIMMLKDSRHGITRKLGRSIRISEGMPMLPGENYERAMQVIELLGYD